MFRVKTPFFSPCLGGPGFSSKRSPGLSNTILLNILKQIGQMAYLGNFRQNFNILKGIIFIILKIYNV